MKSLKTYTRSESRGSLSNALWAVSLGKASSVLYKSSENNDGVLFCYSILFLNANVKD